MAEFAVGDSVIIKESEGLHPGFWNVTGVIARRVEKSTGYDYDWEVDLDSDPEGSTPLVTYSSELELTQ